MPDQVFYLWIQSAGLLFLAVKLYLTRQKLNDLRASQAPTPTPMPVPLSVYPSPIPDSSLVTEAPPKARRKHHPRNYYTKDMITTAKLLIHNRGMTLKEAAAILGVSSSTICRYAHLKQLENGETPDNTSGVKEGEVHV